MTTIAQYAETIKTAILDDVRAGLVPATVRDFSDLHDHIDANEYLISAGVPWDLDPQTGETDLGPTNAVTDAVHEWLQGGGIVRALTADVDLLDDERAFVTAFLDHAETFTPDPTTEPYDAEGIAIVVNDIIADIVA